MAKSNLSRYGRARKLKKIYLDYAASASANPSSIHAEGMRAKIKLQNARIKVATVLGAQSEEIIFTSGGTESSNLAIQGMVFKFWELGFQKGTEPLKIPHIITTNIEHPSVLETCKMLEKRKLAEISIIPVEADGIMDSKKIRKEMRENTILVSVMYANNEIGTIQPIREIAKEIRHYKKGKNASKKHGYFSAEKFLVPAPSRSRVSLEASFPVFHVDAVQAVNYLNLDVKKLGVDLLSLSGSKIDGAGRIGVLYKKKSVPLTAIFGGGDQEMGLRPGTESLPEILKFAKALESAQKIKEKEIRRLTKLRDYFFEELLKLKNQNSDFDFLINGDLKNRLPNNINITFPGIPSDLLVIELSAKNIMASSKSACKSSHREGSYVIQAIRPKSDPEIGGVRFSLGRQTTKADINRAIKALSKILPKLKKWKQD